MTSCGALMPIWFSIPSIVVPEAIREKKEEQSDFLHHKIFKGFGYSAEVVKDNLLIPRAWNIDSENLASASIEPLLKVYAAERLPGVLIDCRSSAPVGGPAPSYKLGILTGLTSILPFSLSGQAGSEVVQALYFFNHMVQVKNNGAIIAAIQKIVPPDIRVKGNGFPLADAAASIFVSTSDEDLIRGFRVLSIAFGQGGIDWKATIDALLRQLIDRANLQCENINWSIAHRFSDSFLTETRRVLSKCMHLNRDLYPEFDFGCADLLISLSRIFSEVHSRPNGIGIIWFAGRFGSVGAILLETFERGV